ncbi:MAG: flagellar protein FlaG [Gallionella sp.]
MLIQNITSSPVPATAVSNGSAGSPPAGVSVPQSGGTPEAAQATVQKSPQPGVAQAAQPGNAQLQSAVDKLNQAMLAANTGVEFAIDQDSKRTVVKVVDTQTGDTIRQLPSKELIAIGQSIDQFQKGMLLKQKA